MVGFHGWGFAQGWCSHFDNGFLNMESRHQGILRVWRLFRGCQNHGWSHFVATITPATNDSSAMRLRTAIEIVKKAGIAWFDHDATAMGAALAFYAMFSVAPLLIIAIAISGFVFGEDAARGQIVHEMDGLVGKEGALVIQSLIENADRPKAGIWATVTGVVVLMFGASGVFGQLQDALNKIWGVAPKPGQTVITMVRRRFLSFAMTLVVGFLLLISLALTAWLSALGTFVAGIMPEASIIGQMLNLLVSFGVIALLFAMIYKVLPDAKIGWQDVWAGALVTALLFTLGKHVIGLYLGTSAVRSAYGAAGSLVVLLLWVYYSSQILFFGAEITKAYAVSLGSYCADTAPVSPAPGAERTEEG